MKKNLLISFLIFAQFSFYAQKEISFYRVDTIQTRVLWKCDKHNGDFKLQSGGLVVSKDNYDILGGKFIIDIKTLRVMDMDTAQYKTAIIILQNTLINEFFEVHKYPYAIFDIQKVVPLGLNKYRFIGDLNLHRIENCISIDVEVKRKDKIIEIKSDKFKIDRTDWGIYRMSPQRPYSDDNNDWTVDDVVELQVLLRAKEE